MRVSKFYIVLDILVAILLCISSCTTSAERAAALRTVAVADSLDSQGILYSDTVCLSQAVDALCRLTHRTEKAKALYYLGRNYSVKGEDAAAVDYYIEADRLEPDDARLRGRLYGNMAYICARQNKDSLAVVFREGAMHYFAESFDTLKLYSAMLENVFSLCKMQNFSNADSILKIIYGSGISDSVFCGRINMIGAYYYYSIDQYDSALVLLDTSREVVNKSDIEFRNSLYSLIYLQTGETSKSVNLSEWIVNNSNNPAYLSSAYYVLREDARKRGDIDAVAEYDSQRKDVLDSSFVAESSRIVAINKLENYIEHKDDISSAYIYLILFVIVICAFGMYILLYEITSIKKKQQTRLKEKEIINERMSKIGESDIEELFHWNNEEKFYNDTNKYLYGMGEKLKSSFPNITHKDLQFCALIIMNVKLNYAAYILRLSPGGIKNVKQRLSHKLGTQSSQIHSFLLELLLK